MMTNYTDLAATLMASATRSIENTRKGAKSIVASILADPDSATAMSAFFTGARGQYLAYKRDGAKIKATIQGKAWRQAREAMEYHFSEAGFKAIWPNWASGDGSPSLATKVEASSKAKAEAAARAERDAEQLAQHESEQAQAESQQLREMGPDDMAASLCAALAQWSNDPDMIRECIGTLATQYGLALAAPDTGKATRKATCKATTSEATKAA